MRLETPEDVASLTLSNSDDTLVQLENKLQSMRQIRSAPQWLLPALFQLLERHPDVDFGAPGTVVHFVEAYPRQAYEAELLASLQRRPTTHTTWMLNRLINGSSGDHRLTLLDTMRKLSAAEQSDVRKAASHFATLTSR